MLGLGNTLRKASGALSSYIRDGLKLYMPYSSSKEVKFVGQGSTLFADGDYIEVADSSSLDLGTSDFTVCAWVNLSTSATDGYAIVYKEETTGTDTGFGIKYYEDDIKIDFGDNSADLSSYLPSFTAVSTNVWHYLSFVFDRTAGTVQGYLDGVIKGTTLDISSVSGSIDTSTALFIGKDSGSSNYMNGSMKNVAIWNRKISATEIQNVMHKTYTDLSGTLTSGLKGWWALEGNYLDSTSNDNDGTNNGSTANTSLYGGITPLIPRGFDNAPTVQADAIGTGYADFGDATTNYITFSEIALTGDFTVGGWYYMHDVTTTNNLFGDSANEDWLRVENATQMEFKIANSPLVAFNTGFTLVANTWVHIMATRTSGAIVIYVNGIKGTGGTKAGTFTPHFLGVKDSSSWADWYHGYMKNIAIWSRALTQAEISSVMEKTYSELISSEKTSLSVWWGMDSTVGDGLNHVADEHDTTLGSELVTNGDFATGDFTDWDSSGNGWSVSGGVATFAYTDEGNSKLVQDIGISSGLTYTLTFDYTRTAGSLTIREYGSGYVTLGTYSDASGSVELNFTSASSNGNLYITAVSTTFAGTIDNVSLKEVSGNYGELK